MRRASVVAVAIFLIGGSSATSGEPRPSPAADPHMPPEVGDVAARGVSPGGGGQRSWLGPDGHPLPFADEAEIVDFLRTAAPVAVTELGSGWTRPSKVLLERDGVRMHAIFRSFERQQAAIVDPESGRRYAEFRDSAMSEVPAYLLSELLGLHLVPPAVERTLRNRDGTLQVWIESAMTEEERAERGVEPPDLEGWRMLLETMNVFDNLIYNADRNAGNFLIQPDWRVWLVDHTRAFQVRNRLRNPDSIRRIDRGLWARLKELDENELEATLRPHLDTRQLGMLERRRTRLLELIDRLIEEHGEGRVLFDLRWPPATE